MPYFVYILQSLKDGSYYIGSTQDLDARVERHNQGRSSYTKARRPWKLVYSEEHPDRFSAVRFENEVRSRKHYSSPVSQSSSPSSRIRYRGNGILMAARVLLGSNPEEQSSALKRL